MVPQVEYGNLYKFMASVAIVLIAASVAVPWLLTHSISVLLVSQETLDGLPEQARDSLARRRDLIVWAQDWLPLPVFLILGGCGIALLAWALIQWAPSQRRADAVDQITLEKSEAEYRNMTRDEAEARREDEVAEAVVGQVSASHGLALVGQAEAVVRSAESTAGSPTSSESEERTQRTDRPDLPPVAAMLERLRLTERRVGDLFVAAYAPPFQVEREVRFTKGHSEGRTLDILLDPLDEDRSQLGVEVKLAPRASSLIRVDMAMTQTAVSTQDLKLGKVHTGLKGRPRDAKVSGICVYVVEDAEDLDRYLPRMRMKVLNANKALARPVGVLVVSAERLDELTESELRRAVAPLWAGMEELVYIDTSGPAWD